MIRTRWLQQNFSPARNDKCENYFVTLHLYQNIYSIDKNCDTLFPFYYFVSLMKGLLFFLGLALFVGGILLLDIYSLFAWLLILIGGGLLVYIIYRRFKYVIDEENRQQREFNERRMRQIQEKRRENETHLIETMASYDAQFGICSNFIYQKHWGYDSNFKYINYVRVYEQTKVIVVNDIVLYFNDIISCDLQDTTSVIHGKSIISSTSKNSNVLKSAIIGGAIAGPLGAAVGAGAFGQKNVSGEITHEKDTVNHKYVLTIFIKSLTMPQLELNFGNDGKIAKQTYALINAILAIMNDSKMYE